MVILLSFGTVFASGDAERGAKLFSKCIACHGKDGMGKRSQKAPMLAGQFDWYLVSQIKAIKSGTRSNKNSKKMVAFVKNLKDDQIEDLAAYISSMPIKK